MTQVTEKSTKAQILKAYEEAMAQLKATSRKTIADEQEAKRVTGVIENAEAIVGLGILNPEIEKQYNDLKEAIELTKKELEELFSIKAEALSLEALVNAKNDEKAKLDNEIKATKEAEQARLEEANKAYNEVVHRLNKDHEEKRKALEIERKREKEEYDYNLKRERKKQDDAWEDEKAEREKELADRELAVEAREDAILAQENEIVILKNKVAEIPALIENAVEKAVDEAKAKASKSYAIEKNHLNREHEWEVKSLQSEISNLKAQVEAERDARVKAEADLKDAFAQVQEIATTSVKASQVKVYETQNLAR